ncbi:MAG TPA: hypothetical protein GX504_02135 [Clostridia bacterium]|nr:hypothetical protein [Clostridia bacterium]
MELSFALRLVVDGRDVLRLEGAFVGFFSVIKGSENMEMERFMEAHAPALMFPYIREHISTVTQKAGVKPVLLPPLNIKALVKTAEERPDHSAQVCISKSREDT